MASSLSLNYPLNVRRSLQSYHLVKPSTIIFRPSISEAVLITSPKVATDNILIRRGRILSCAVSEEEIAESSAEIPAEETEESVPAEDDSNQAEGETFVRKLLSRLREGIESNNDSAVEEVQAQLEALDKDREYLGQQVASLTEEVSLGKDRLLRLNADFENFRKRSDKEKSELATSVKGDVVEQLLPMIDNFERAKTSLRTESEAEKKIENSYQSIYKQFVEAMKALGVSAVETLGRDFDPNVHDAIMREESVEYAEGAIIEEFRKGFTIGSKLLRPSMVKVSSGPGPRQGGAKGGDAKPPQPEITSEEEHSTVEEGSEN